MGETPMDAEGAVERFSPLFNDAFLQIFGRQDSIPVTKPLVNAILRKIGLPEIQQIDSISADASSPGGVTCRTPRCDVLILSGDRVIDLEAQRRKVNIANKALFYAARLLGEYAPKGGDDAYGDMPQVVVVVLAEGFELFPEADQVVSTCTMTWDVDGRPVMGSDRMLFVLAELDKVRERYTGSTGEVLTDELTAWLYLLANGYRDQREVDDIMAAFPTIEEFAERYGIAIGDPELKRRYFRLVGDTLEYNSIMRAAKDDARAEGLAEGRAAGLAEGRAEGLAEGRAEGRAEGLAEGREGLADRLRELGVDETLLEKALATLQREEDELPDA